MRSVLFFSCLLHAAGLRMLAEQADDFTSNSSALPLWHDADYWQDDPNFPAMSLAESLAEAPKYETDFRKEPRSRVIVLPEHKLAFCYIEKNACSQFNRLFNTINHWPKGSVTWWHSTMMNFNLDWDDVSRAKGWKWAIFLRDPLLRYLSAWGSKCVQREDHGNCLPKGMFSPNAKVADFEANVRASFHVDAARELNAHWARQQDFCGGLKDAADYDFVGLLRGDVHGQVKAMLEMVNASYEDLSAFFPKDRVAGHHSSLLPSTYYQNESVQMQVMEMYAEDFSLPGLAPHLIAKAES